MNNKKLETIRSDKEIEYLKGVRDSSVNFGPDYEKLIRRIDVLSKKLDNAHKQEVFSE